MKESQCNKIISHIKEHGSITSLDAIKNYGILRLASRVNDLKRRGFPIEATMVTGENRDGETVRYAVYTLTEDK
jgi:hypothetical protein